MNVVTAVPSKQRTKVSAARRWAAASKSFTGISEQDPGVSLGNRQFRHLLRGDLMWERNGRRSGEAWKNDVQELRSHGRTPAPGLDGGEVWGLQRCDPS